MGIDVAGALATPSAPPSPMLDDEEIVRRRVAAVLVYLDRQGDVATIGPND